MNKNIYKLYNPKNEAEIRCTEKYLASWIARGFEVKKIIIKDNNQKDNLKGTKF